MASKKQGRAKVQEESLAAQLAEMRGDLSDKDLNEILTSARYERTNLCRAISENVLVLVVIQ